MKMLIRLEYYSFVQLSVLTFMKKLLFLAFMLISLSSFSSHFAGGDIEYYNIGVRKWKIRLTVYRDCTGCATCFSNASLGSALSPGMVAKPNTTLNPAGCSATPNQVNVSMSLVKVEDIMKHVSLACGPSAKNGCTNLGTVTGGPSSPSVEKWIFEGTLDLSMSSLNSSNCAFWDISYTSGLRNVGMINMPSENFSIGATLNIYDRQSSGQSNSPTITNEPIITVCSGQEFRINMGTVDVDGDSLSYHLIPAFQSYPNTIGTYTSPYSYLRPFPLNPNAVPHINFPQPTGPYVILDTINGDISFNAINNSPSFIFGDLCVMIKQWTKDASGTAVLVGQTMRDMQFYTLACPANRLPNIITNPSLSNGQPRYNYEICAGQQLCFTITAKDSDVYPAIPRFDTTRILWNNSIVRPGKLTFGPTYDTTTGARPREDQWQFCWTTVAEDARDQPYFFTTLVMDNACPRVGQFIKSFSINVKAIPALVDSVSKLSCNRYILNIKKLKSSAKLDSVIVQIANNPNDFTFSGGFRTIAATQLNPIFTGNNPESILIDTFGYHQPGRYLVKYTGSAIGAASCPNVTYYDTITVDSFPPFSLTDTTVCLGANLNFSLPSGNYTWRLSGGASNIGMGNTLNYTVTSNTAIIYSGLVTSGAFQNCALNDTVFVTQKAQPTFTLPDSVLLCNGQVVLNATNQTQGQSTSYLWSDSGVETIKTVTIPGVYKVTATQTNGCSAADSVKVFASNNINLLASNDTIICSGNIAKLRVSGAQNYQWGYLASGNYTTIGPKVIAGTLEVTPSASTTYLVTGYTYATDTTIKQLSCSQTDTIVVSVNQTPTLSPISALSVCRTTPELQLPTRIASPANLQGGLGVWTWKGSTSVIKQVGSTYSVEITKLPGLPLDTLYTNMENNPNGATKNYYINYTYQAPTSVGGCSKTDSVLVRVLATPKVFAGDDMNFCSNRNKLFSLSDTYRTPIDQTGTKGVWNTVKGPMVSSVTQGAIKTFYFNPDLNAIQLPDTNILAYTYTLNYNLTSPSTVLPCSNTDYLNIFVQTAPVIDGGTDKEWCNNTPEINLRTTQQVDSRGYFRIEPSVTPSEVFKPSTALLTPNVNKIYYIYDSVRCTSIDSFTYRVYAAPQANAGTDGVFCETAPAFVLQNIQQATPAGGIFYNSQSVAITTFTPGSAPLLPDTSLIVYRYGQVNNSVTCYGYDTVVYKVSPVANLQSIIGESVVAKNSVKTYSTQSNPYHSLVWNVTGGQLQSSQDNEAVILWTDTGTATIKVTAQSTVCSDVVLNRTVIVQTSTGLSEQTLSSLVKLYPNPASQSVTVSFESNRDAYLELYSSTMQSLKQVPLTSLGGQIQAQISTQDLANGVYFIRVISGDQSGLFKLIVMK